MIGSSFKVGGDTDKSNYQTVSIFISVSRISKDILFDKLHYFLKASTPPNFFPL